MKKLYYLGLFYVIILLSSCFEDDYRIIPVPIQQVEIPYSMYDYQTYYSITDSSIVSYNDYADWDLGFESSEDGYHIILNYAKYMYAGNTFEKDFVSVKSNIAEKMIFDHSSGNLDSTVLRDWADYSDPVNPIFNDYVYIIDRGKNESGEEFGFKKIVFEKLENDTFYVHFANLDNTQEFYSKIPKNPDVNFTLFSLDNGGSIAVAEPDKDKWDLCFTKYSTVIPDDYGTPTDYLVRGVFLNPNKNIEVALDTVNNFYDIIPEMVSSYTYSTKRDAIGYDWKYFVGNFYEMRNLNTYILKNVSGLDYKIRFTSFYKEGIKGYPAFELMQLITY